MRACECLYDLIGISDKCVGMDRCLHYIDSMPGIESNDFEYLTTAGVSLASEVWERIQHRAIPRIITDIELSLVDKFTVNHIVEDIQTGIWDKGGLPSSINPGWSGYKIDFFESRNLSAYIDKVELFHDGNTFPVSSSIRIVDLHAGCVIDEIPFTLESDNCGFFTVPIEKQYYAKSLMVQYDSGVISSRKVQTHTSNYYEDVCNPCGCTTTKAQCAFLEYNEEQSRQNIYHSCGGMIVHYSCCCSLEPWICRNKGKVAKILLYLVGIEFFTEVSASRRLNELTMIDVDRLDKLTAYCYAMYNNALKAFARGIKISDRVCTECVSDFKILTIKN